MPLALAVRPPRITAQHLLPCGPAGQASKEILYVLPGFHCISFAGVAGLIKVSSMDKDGQGSCIPASEMVRVVLISSGRAFDPSLNFIWLPCLLCLAVISHAFRGSLTPCRQKRALGALFLSWPAHLLLSLLFRSNRPMLNHS